MLVATESLLITYRREQGRVWRTGEGVRVQNHLKRQGQQIQIQSENI